MRTAQRVLVEKPTAYIWVCRSSHWRWLFNNINEKLFGIKLSKWSLKKNLTFSSMYPYTKHFVYVNDVKSVDKTTEISITLVIERLETIQDLRLWSVYYIMSSHCYETVTLKLHPWPSPKALVIIIPNAYQRGKYWSFLWVRLNKYSKN